MDKIIFEGPTGIAVKFTGRETTNANETSLLLFMGFRPRNTELGSEFGDIFIVFKISPKFDFGTRFLL